MQRDEQSGRFVRRQSQRRNQPTSSEFGFRAGGGAVGRQRRRAAVPTTIGLLAGAGIGAGLMFLLDPYEGARRRQQLADAAADAMHSTSSALGSAWETVSERAADAGSAIAAHLPDASDMSKHGRRMFNRASDSAQDTAHGWIDRARAAMPSMPSMPRLRRPTDISATTAATGGFGLLALGLGAMWLMDPQRGRGRRAWIGQKATRLVNETGDFMRATGRHLANKSKGYYYETRSAAECAMESMTGAEQSAQQQQPEQSASNLSA